MWSIFESAVTGQNSSSIHCYGQRSRWELYIHGFHLQLNLFDSLKMICIYEDTNITIEEGVPKNSEESSSQQCYKFTTEYCDIGE